MDVWAADERYIAPALTFIVEDVREGAAQCECFSCFQPAAFRTTANDGEIEHVRCQSCHVMLAEMYSRRGHRIKHA